MTKVPSLNYYQVIRALRRDGWVVVRQKGRLGDKTIDLKEGMSVFVPAGMIHQFWTKDEEGLDFIIIMFGEGA